MKKNVNATISFIACLLTVICIFQISELKRQIRNLESSMNNQITGVRNIINSNNDSMNRILTEQESLLTESSWEYGKPNMDSLSIELNCHVTPKEYTSGLTTASIVMGSKEYPMTLENGAFIATIEVPIMDESIISKVMFHEGEIVRSELLDWSISPHFECLPSFFARMEGGSTGRAKGDYYLYHRTGMIHIDLSETQLFESKSLQFIEVLNGVEQSRVDIPKDSTSQNKHNSSSSSATVSVSPYGTSSTSKPIDYDIDKEYKIPFGGVLELYVEMVDNYGLHYRTLLDRQEISNDGSPVNNPNDSWRFGVANIYDKDGNALYEINKENVNLN